MEYFEHEIRSQPKKESLLSRRVYNDLVAGGKCKWCETFCKHKLKQKIKINMKEWKRKRFKSQKQALAVSYAQVKKKFPKCKKYFRKV